MTSEAGMGSIYTAGRPYAVALGSVVLAIALRRLLDGFIGDEFPFATVFLAILITAWDGGLRPALLAVVLGAVGAVLFLLPRFSWNADSSDQAGLLLYGQRVGLVLYAFVGIGMAVLGGAMHRSRMI